MGYFCRFYKEISFLSTSSKCLVAFNTFFHLFLEHDGKSCITLISDTMFTDCSCLGCEKTHLHVTVFNETYTVLIFNHLSIRVPNFEEKFVRHQMFPFDTFYKWLTWPRPNVTKMAEDHNKIVTSSHARLAAAIVISLLSTHC